MLREPGAPRVDELPQIHETKTQSVDLPVRIMAARALRTQVQATKSHLFEQEKVVAEIRRQHDAESTELHKVLHETIGAIQQELKAGRLDIHTASEMWAAATGRDFPEQLFDKIGQIYQGTRLMQGWVLGVATGKVNLVLMDKMTGAFAEVEGDPPLIGINDNIAIGDLAIIDALRGKLEGFTDFDLSYAGSLHQVDSIVKTVQRAQKLGVEVPAELVGSIHELVGKVLKGNVQKSLDTLSERDALFTLLEDDALSSRQTDNIDYVLREIVVTRYNESSRATLRKVGIALDIAEHGEDSIFTNRHLNGLPPEDVMEQNLRAEMEVLSRYTALLSSQEASVAE